jgi:sulfide:quinone oxidoreductase
LALFGERASEEVAELLRVAGIELHTGVVAERVEGRGLTTATGTIETDRVVALPHLLGPRLRGFPSDAEGFIPTDRHGLVEGLENVYAAGDATTFPIKQGGLATQQADAAAEAIAARLDASVRPREFEPVLRGLLMTGAIARYLDAEGGARPALWAPNSKVFGRYLLPYLGGVTTAEGLVPDESETVEADLAAGWARA